MNERDVNLPTPPLVIKFPRTVGTAAFEVLLKESHKSSLSGAQKVVFDLTGSHWCGVFEVSLLSLWILELREKGIDVAFRFPTEPGVQKFLRGYKVDKFLDEAGVLKENESGGSDSATPSSPFRAPYYPLTYLNEQQFTRLLRELKTGNRLEMVLQDLTDTEIVRTGAIRDVVLKELGDNIHLHSGGSSANMIMTKRGTQVYSEARAHTDALLREVTDLEKPFFTRLYGQSFLTLVIADKGIGLANSLRGAYDRDSLLENKKPDPAETDILEYAFLYHSTRRSIEERIGEINEYISKDAVKFPPPTGLYRLKELVREFYGLLYVRSGSSIVCYDFYSDHSRDEPRSNTDVKGLESLAYFPGTQYKIYFPVKLSPQQQAAKIVRLGTAERTAAARYEYLSVRPYGVPNAGAGPGQEAEGLFLLLQELNRLLIASSGKQLTVVLDFHNQQLFSPKALHYILVEAMQRQTSKFSVVVINLRVEESQWREAFKGRDDSPRGMMPLAVLGEGYNVHFFGPPPEEMRLLKDMADPEGEQGAEALQLGEKYTYLFTFNLRANRYDFVHPPAALIPFVKDAVKARLAEVLMSPSAGIFQKDARVLIPSGNYCEGYFEIYKLFANDDWSHSLYEWFKYWLILLRPNFVISITGHIGNLLAKAVDEVGQQAGGMPISHVRVETPVREEELINLTLNDSVTKDQKGIIFSDVIGTTNTLKSVLRHVQHTDVLKIIAVVNAAEEDTQSLEFKGKVYEVDALVRHPLNYYRSLPATWLYSNVHLVDPENHVLIREEIKSEGPLWEEQRIRSDFTRFRDEEIEILINNFLESCVISPRAYVEGHLTMGGRHMVYLFNMPALMANHLDDLAPIVKADADKKIIRSTSYSTVSRVFYLAFNPGMDVIAARLSADYPAAQPVQIDENELYTPEQEYGAEDLGAVILLDDAFVSGDSLLRAYDVVERRGARLILAYVLVKRGNEYLARRLEKITRYGSAEVQIRYLADVEIPAYTEQDCPICKWSSDLLKLKDALPKDDLLESHVGWEIGKAAPLPVELVFAEGRFETSSERSDVRLRMRWRLELAKRKPGPRKELATIVRRFNLAPNEPTHFMQVSCLLQVLAREQHIFLIDRRVRDDIFYFTHDIVIACRWIIENATEITSDIFGATLTVVRAFDEEYLIGNLHRLYESTVSSRDKFAQVTLHTFLSRRAREYPGMVANVLEKLLLNSGGAPVEQTIDILWRHWRNEEERALERKNSRLICFKELSGGTLHEIGHLRENVEAAAMAGYVDPDQLSTDWLAFSEHVTRILPLLRGCIGSNVTRELQDKMQSKIAAIDFQLRQARGLFLGAGDGTDRLAGSHILLAADQLRQCADRIIDLIYTVPDNVASLLGNLKTNVKTIASRIIQQQQKDLRQAGIRVVRDFPEGACLVFGEEVHVGQIFQNLIENVWKYSGGTLLEIAARVHPDKERIDLVFLDDGRGIPDANPAGHGLRIVIRNVKYYCGEFEIDNLSVGDDEYAEGFRTKAVVTLPYFRERDEDD